MFLEAFYGDTVKKQTYSPAKLSSYAFGKADALKKLTEEGRFSDFFTVNENIKFLCLLNLDILMFLEAFYGDTVKKTKLIRLPNFPHIHSERQMR